MFLTGSTGSKGAFTLANFACDFALSLHVLLNKNYLFSLLNVQASVKSCQCKRTFSARGSCKHRYLKLAKLSHVAKCNTDIYE